MCKREGDFGNEVGHVEGKAWKVSIHLEAPLLTHKSLCPHGCNGAQLRISLIWKHPKSALPKATQ